MEHIHDTVSELLEITREIAGYSQPEGAAFALLLARRGELIRRLCSGGLDPADVRVRTVLREGAALLTNARQWRDSLREQAASLDLLAVACGGMQAALPRPDPVRVLDISA